MNKRILVTGGAGFIGSHLVERLEAARYDVLVLDNFSTGRSSNLPRSTRVVEADLCRPRAAAGVIGGFCPEAVVHLAAQVNVRRSIENPASDADVNILGGIRLLKACADYNVRRVVFASSGGAIYGEQEIFPIPEAAVPKPESPYALSKQAIENYGRYFSRAGGLEFVALRLGNVYGPRQDPRGEAGVIAIFLSKFMRGVAPAVFGDGTHTRDYVWVGDATRAFELALGSPTGTYNIGTGVETQTLEIVRELKKVTGSRLEPEFAPEVPGEVRRNSLDSTLARSRLNWAPEVSLASGLRRLQDRESSPHQGSEASVQGSRAQVDEKTRIAALE